MPCSQSLDAFALVYIIYNLIIFVIDNYLLEEIKNVFKMSTQVHNF